MKKLHLFGNLCAVLFSLIAVSANATLHGRLPLTPGGTDYQAAYDDVLDITWLTDADLGHGNWDNRMEWASGLNILGFDDWRLPSMSVAAGLLTGTTTSVVDCSSATELACRDNELGYMFYYNMGGSNGDDKTGDQTVDGVLLTNVHAFHWSVTAFDSGVHWYFVFHNGHNARSSDFRYFSGWAVRSGDVGAPVEIYIKPRNKRNIINPRLNGGIWVAILSDTNPESPFDPSSQVDIATVEFGTDGAKVIRVKVKDINEDGLGDLFLRFMVPDTGIACGDTDASLTGETFDGQSFTGTDSIETFECKQPRNEKY